jgi:hypothetical protein
MKQCPVIQDLLPLYVDDALSRESWVLVDEHLAGCVDCRQALAAMRDGVPSVAAPIDLTASDEVRWLSRLKRQVGTTVGVVILLLAAMPIAPFLYIGWRNEREMDRLMEARMQAENAAVAAIGVTSPDPLARLRARGVTITTVARHEDGRLQVRYTLNAASPTEAVYPFMYGPVAMPRLIDPANGDVIGRLTNSSYRNDPGRPTWGELIFDGVAALPAGTQLQMPYLMVYLKPEPELKWEFVRPGKEGDVLLSRRFSVAGIEFEVERIRFTEAGADIDYHQVSPSSQVGSHLLSFRLSDRMGGSWSDQPLREHLPDPLRPSQHFDFVPSLSKNWLIEVQHAVLALPGPTIPLEVR